MNRVNISGRLTETPELKYTETNNAISHFTIASQRNYKNAMGERESDYIRCIAFNKTAETTSKYCKKGDLVGVDGRIQTGSYTNKDGNKVYTTDVVIDRIDFYKQATQNVEQKEKEEPKENPFADFGEQVSLDDNFLED